MKALIELQPSQSSDTRFDRWWHSEGEWVEPPNQRRGGESGVRRLVPRDAHRPVPYYASNKLLRLFAESESASPVLSIALREKFRASGKPC